MNRTAVALLVVAACTEHGHPASDAPAIDAHVVLTDVPSQFPPIDAPVGGNQGFAEPSGLVSAWTELSPGMFQFELLDLSCLHAPRNDAATVGPVDLGVHVIDFQLGNSVVNAAVVAFAGTDPSAQLATTTTGSGGTATLMMPGGTKRIGYKTTAPSLLPSLMFDLILVPGQSMQIGVVLALSSSSATTLPALVGVSASPSNTIEIGTITDCQGHTLANTIATVSTVSGSVVQLGAVDTYYVSEATSLPVRRTQAAATTRKGQFMILDVPMTATAFIQIWGFLTTADQASHTLRLLAELGVPVPAASAVFTRHDPRATQ